MSQFLLRDTWSLEQEQRGPEHSELTGGSGGSCGIEGSAGSGLIASKAKYKKSDKMSKDKNVFWGGLVLCVCSEGILFIEPENVLFGQPGTRMMEERRVIVCYFNLKYVSGQTRAQPGHSLPSTPSHSDWGSISIQKYLAKHNGYWMKDIVCTIDISLKNHSWPWYSWKVNRLWSLSLQN